jgi:aminocarboxymuconate-semialdehyde decarboxylase
VHDPDALDFLIKKMGIDRIILGSDYPFPLGEQAPGEMVMANNNLTDNDKAKILGLNALEFFGSRIDKSKFARDQ